jgi:hypothetical protein
VTNYRGRGAHCGAFHGTVPVSVSAAHSSKYTWIFAGDRSVVRVQVIFERWPMMVLR